jgi:hypothetical protein
MTGYGSNTRNAEYQSFPELAFFAQISLHTSTLHSESREFANTNVDPVQPSKRHRKGKGKSIAHPTTDHECP